MLDDVLEGRKTDAVAAGFGEKLQTATVARRRWLLSQGLAVEDGESFRVDRVKLTRMAVSDLEVRGAELGESLGKPYRKLVEGEPVSGVYRKPVDLPARRFAIIENSKEFTLAPWRDALEARRGLEVSGIVRRGGVTWTFGRARPGPER